MMIRFKNKTLPIRLTEDLDIQSMIILVNIFPVIESFEWKKYNIWVKFELNKD